MVFIYPTFAVLLYVL